MSFLKTSVFAALALSLFAIELQAQETIKMSVATSLQRGLFKPVPEEFKKATGIEVTYNPSGTTKTINTYIQDMLDGKAEAAVAPVSWDDWVQLMKDEKFVLPPNVQLTHRVVGKDLFEVYAHKDVGVSRLTQPQLESLFSGKIKNWKELGGADAPVTIILSADRMATRKSFGKIAMNNKPFDPGAKEVPRNEPQRELVGTTPGAVAFDSQVPTLPNVIKIQIPPLGKPATMLTIGRPSPKIEKLIKFMREREK